MISYRDLVPGKEYYIQTHDTQGYHKEMIFVDYETAVDDNMMPEYHVNLIMIFRQHPTDMRRTTYYSFYEEDYYYNPEIIRENAKKARQEMEQRSLNIILKKIVNENFEWF